ncbi:MAG: sigma-54 dependent transcriptional regulator [Candidatus Cloacimonetes bacterium]|nr:sigma-54 dependent transcriptional regulator [Candidatus Cloacimonadota bacterium]
MDKIRVLVADDDQNFCTLIHTFLSRKGYDAIKAETPAKCLEILANKEIDLLLLDLCFPTLREGFSVLDHVKARHRDVSVMMISGEGHIPDAVMAIKKGAADFLEKPFDYEHLLAKIEYLCALNLQLRELHSLEKTAIGMVGVSPAMERVFDEIIHASRFTCSVLISGETGVGKELAANAIHRLSRFKDQNIVCINCAAIPKDMMEAELFGYEKGAFTGAVNSHKGYFEISQGSTIFLDEIVELPLSAQAKLLRVLSEGEIQKLGGNCLKIETRVICATNQNLEALIEQKEFREDLFYRINTITIHIPPLRQRREDILPLVQYFANLVCHKNNMVPKTFSPQAQSWLLSQEWRGNIRELANVVERAVIFTKGDLISVADLLHTHTILPPCELDNCQSLKNATDNFQKSYISHCLDQHQGNVKQAANSLKIDRSNLYKLLKSLGIQQ